MFGSSFLFPLYAGLTVFAFVFSSDECIKLSYIFPSTYSIHSVMYEHSLYPWTIFFLWINVRRYRLFCELPCFIYFCQIRVQFFRILIHCLSLSSHSSICCGVYHVCILFCFYNSDVVEFAFPFNYVDVLVYLRKMLYCINELVISICQIVKKEHVNVQLWISLWTLKIKINHVNFIFSFSIHYQSHIHKR